MNDSDNIKGIFFFDLDGTLLDNRIDKVPESALTALSELKRQGCKVVISTGRDMDTHYSVKYIDIVKPDAIIHANGNKITIGGRLLYKHVMDKKLLRRIIDFSKEHGICVGTSVGNEDFYVNLNKKVYADESYNKYINRNFADVEELFSRNIEVHALSFAGDIFTEGRLLEQNFTNIRLLPFNTGVGADIIEEGYTKADGMRRVCDYYKVPYDKTYAIGDSMNDIHIIKEAGVGIAMGNADQPVKDAADFVTTDIADNGVYNACVRLGLIKGTADETADRRFTQ